MKMKTKPKSWMEIRALCATNPRLGDLRPWLGQLTQELADWPDVDALNRVTSRQEPGFPWTFMKQEKIPSRARSKGIASLSGYLHLVLEERKIPIREFLLHDLLNALSFVMFPLAKTALALRHRSESPDGITPGQNRTRTQDLLTIFDEGGVIRLNTPTGQSRDLVFGHAIYEHLINGAGLRAARLDFNLGDEIISRPIQELTKITDSLLANWFGDASCCLSASEFASVEIP